MSSSHQSTEQSDVHQRRPVNVMEEAQQVTGPYAAAGHPTLPSPTLDQTGFRIVLIDIIAAWNRWEWQNLVAFLVAACLYSYVRRIRDPQRDMEGFIALRLGLCWALCMSWGVEMLYRIVRQDREGYAALRGGGEEQRREGAFES